MAGRHARVRRTVQAPFARAGGARDRRRTRSRTRSRVAWRACGEAVGRSRSTMSVQSSPPDRHRGLRGPEPSVAREAALQARMPRGSFARSHAGRHRYATTRPHRPRRASGCQPRMNVGAGTSSWPSSRSLLTAPGVTISRSIPTEVSGGVAAWETTRREVSSESPRRSATARPFGSRHSPTAKAPSVSRARAISAAFRHVVRSTRSSARRRSSIDLAVRTPCWAACSATISADASAEGTATGIPTSSISSARLRERLPDRYRVSQRGARGFDALQPRSERRCRSATRHDGWDVSPLTPRETPARSLPPGTQGSRRA